MDKKYLQNGWTKTLAHVVEECGEVLSAAGKAQRWGLWSVNPELPEDKQETNIEWLKRELKDLKGAISRLELELDKQRPKVSRGTFR